VVAALQTDTALPPSRTCQFQTRLPQKPTPRDRPQASKTATGNNQYKHSSGEREFVAKTSFGEVIDAEPWLAFFWRMRRVLIFVRAIAKQAFDARV